MIYEAFAMAFIQQQLRDAERLADEKYLAEMLKRSPPENHAAIRAAEAARLEKRDRERTEERRHRELCAAIREAGRSARRGFF